MISSIRLQNFRSWEDGTLELHPRVNLILGTGNSGKTNIFRASRWALENRPNGDNLVSFWAKKTGAKGAVSLTKDTSVTITRPDGSFCQRFREAGSKDAKETNGYSLNGERFTAIGVSVPPAVTDWFNWSEVNVQRQFDQAFLISKGAGEVASFLNKTVRLDDIDSHLTAAASLLRSDKATLQGLKDAQEQDSKALGALEWVEAAQVRLEALEALEKERDTTAAKLQRVQGILAQIQAINAKIRESEKVLALEPQVQGLRQRWNYIRGLSEQYHKARELLERWEAARRDQEASAKVLALGPVLQALRERWEGLQASRKDLARASELRGQWAMASRAEQRAGKVLALAPKVQRVREEWERLQGCQERLKRAQDLLSQWPKVREVDWEFMERGIRRMKMLAKGIQDRRDQIERAQKYRLTIGALEASILESGELVSRLEAERPETCPLCGGTNQKGHKDHGYDAFSADMRCRRHF